MRQTRDLCLALAFCLLVTLPLSSVRAQTQLCVPSSSLRTTSVTCMAAGCTPTPPGNVATVVIDLPGTCAIDNDLTVTLTGGAVECTATVTSCEGGIAVTADSIREGSVESAENSGSAESG